MAKKKTKREKKKGFAYSSELYGVIFLLTGIIGIRWISNNQKRMA